MAGAEVRSRDRMVRSFVKSLSTLLTHGERAWEGGPTKRAMMVRNIVGRPVLCSDSLQDGSRPFQIEPARLFSVPD